MVPVRFTSWIRNGTLLPYIQPVPPTRSRLSNLLFTLFRTEPPHIEPLFCKRPIPILKRFMSNIDDKSTIKTSYHPSCYLLASSTTSPMLHVHLHAPPQMYHHITPGHSFPFHFNPNLPMSPCGSLHHDIIPISWSIPSTHFTCPHR